MSNTVVLNSSNVIGNTNTMFQYNFIQGAVAIKEGTELAVGNITIPYSWYNVSSSYSNASFQFTWTVGSTTTTYTVNLPNGFYTVTDINNYLQQYFILNGFYLINGSNNVYYIQLLYDTAYYAIQLITYPVPTSLPSGYTQPSNFVGYPSTTTAPSFIVPSSNSIGTIIGFNPGTYGGGSTTTSTLSNTVPQGSVVNSVVIRCSLVDNNMTMPSDILDSFPINASFGENISYTPTFPKWVKCKPGRYTSFQIVFVDQNFNTIVAIDPTVCITLLLRAS